jgi:MYXO-CTERM domain-containing protein
MIKAHALTLTGVLLTSGCVGIGADGAIDMEGHSITGGSAELGYSSVFALAYNGEGGCSGTCIAPHVGLTAAHCVQGDEASTLTALFGDTEWEPEQVLQVTEVAIEPGFASGTREADIALLRFAEACPATTPYNPYPLEAHVGEQVVMVGFGVTVESASDAGIKRSGVASLFSVAPSEVSGMSDGELATSNDPHGTCDGDSGGPTFMTFDGVEYVVGVTSRGSTGANGVDEPCGQGRSIATRADSYADFIDAFVGGDADDPGQDDPPGDDPPSDDEDPDQDPDADNEQTAAGCQTVPTTAGGLWMLAVLALLMRRRQNH